MYKELIEHAKKVREFSYSPYSNYKVGASLLTKSGKIYNGCNIENAGYTATNCAERTAFFKAVSEGESEFKAIAIVGGFDQIDDDCSPCGVCRQVMSEFCDENFEVILVKKNDFKVFKLGEIMPLMFNKNQLNKQ